MKNQSKMTLWNPSAHSNDSRRGLTAVERWLLSSPAMSIPDDKKNLWVVQYPEQKRDDRPVEEGGQFRPTFRGVHRLNKDEDGRVRCVACFMCATACPANCIHIVAEESPWEDREKYPKQFDIDELRCIYCGMCEEACPVDAIELTPHYEVSGLTRAELIFDKSKLLEIYDHTIAEKPM